MQSVVVVSRCLGIVSLVMPDVVSLCRVLFRAALHFHAMLCAKSLVMP